MPRLGQVAGRDGSVSRGFDPRPEGKSPRILRPLLPAFCPCPEASSPGTQNLGGGRDSAGGVLWAWPMGGGAWISRFRRSGLRAYAERKTGGGADGRAGSGGAGPAPAGTMAKTVAYFYDPDVGNFHYGEGTRWFARSFGTRRF